MAQPTATSLQEFLAAEAEKDLLRFVFVGSVDDGKSTLLGRMLHDTDSVFQDHVEAVRKASTLGGGIDFSLFTDGLKAEREQGITIDVAYRYFSTSRRKFIVADTPGHVQYTRNMVTGASTAQVAVVLIDARLGVLQQSKRHAYIASMLGIRHLLVAINKMDLVGYERGVYDGTCAAFRAFASKLRLDDITFVPVSALQGDNVVERSRHTGWYDGPTLLRYLEEVPATRDTHAAPFRFPVQYVIRPNLDYRGYAGQVASGVLRPGDAVMVLPSAVTTCIKSIDTLEGPLAEATAPLSVTLRLTEEVDVSRGDMIVAATALPQVGRSFEAQLVWLSEKPLDLEKSYVIKHTTQSARAQVEAVETVLDLETLQQQPGRPLQLNDIGRVRLVSQRALYYDAYDQNRSTGAFVLIDSLSNHTVAAGMILDAGRSAQDFGEALRELRAGSGLAAKTQVSRRERLERFGQRGAAIWLTGLPGSGRWSLAYALERRLFDLGRSAHVLDPSGEDLGTITAAAKACADAGLIAIGAFPSFRRDERQQVRQRLGAARFFEVFVQADAALCRERRPDAAVELFEPPEQPALTVALDHTPLAEAVEAVVRLLEREQQFALPELSAAEHAAVVSGALSIGTTRPK